MKTLFFFFTAIIPFALFSQNASIKSEKYDLNGQKQDCYAVFIPGLETDFVTKEWKRFMKNFDSKISDKKEIVATEAKIKELSLNPLTVYTVIEKKDGGIILYVGIDLGGAFLSKSLHSAQYSAFEKKLEEFSKEVRLKAIEERLEDENKKMSSLNKKKDQLIKEKEKQLSNIEKWKQDIIEAENAIKENEKMQDTNNNEIEAQKKVVEEWTNKKKNVK